MWDLRGAELGVNRYCEVLCEEGLCGLHRRYSITGLLLALTEVWLGRKEEEVGQ